MAIEIQREGDLPSLATGLALEGSFEAEFEEAAATFLNLRAKLARNDNRLVYMQVIETVPTGLSVKSDTFTILPGALKSLAFLRDPGLMSPPKGCRRCPTGVHLAGETLPVEIILRDAFHNRIAFCRDGAACSYLPSASVAAQLIPMATAKQAKLTGQLTDECSEGRLTFTDLNVESVGTYSLRLCVVDAMSNAITVAPRASYFELHQTLCANGGNHLKVQADSSPFIIAPNRPAKVSAEAMSRITGEMELLPVQPSILVMDTYDNVADKDCYRFSCAGLNHTCNATGRATCPNDVDVLLYDPDGSPITPGKPRALLHGNTRVSEMRGYAIFTDLAIIADTSEWPGQLTKCGCPNGECRSCSGSQFDSECYLQPPFPYYSLRFRAIDDSGHELASADVFVEVKRRAQVMRIVVQPALIVALEVFASDIVVEVLDCKGEPVRYDSAEIEASINSNAGGGVLAGRTKTQLKGGLAVFTDLGINLFGNGYTLSFTYLGASEIPPVESSPFRVEKPVEVLVQVDTHVFGGNVTAGVSLDVEASQPIVELRGRDNKRLPNTVLPVTASISPIYNPGGWQDWNFCMDHQDCACSETGTCGPSRACGGPFEAAKAEDFCACVQPGQGQQRIGNDFIDSCPSHLLGQTQAIPVEGIVRFTDLALTKASVGQYLPETFPNSPLTYVLMLSLGKVAIDTPVGVLHVLPAEWAGILIPPAGQPDPEIPERAGVPLRRQPIVILVDRFKNRVLGSQIPPNTFVSVSIASGPTGAPIVRRGCFGRGPFTGEILGKPLVEDFGEDCYGTRPVVCKNCPDVNISANSAVGGYVGEASYSDLELVLEGTYRLMFHCRRFKAMSNEFRVINSDPSYPFVLQFVPAVNSADRPFSVQPRLTIKDDYGNFVRVDSIPERIISVKIVGATPIAPRWKTDPPYQIIQDNLAPGQSPGEVCRAAPALLEGTQIVPIDLETGIGEFTDLVLRQVYSNYRLQFTIASSKGDLILNSSNVKVVPGDTVGLCPLQLPDECGARAPCFVSLRVGCVDKYGNINPTCNTKRGDRTLNPTKIPDGFSLDCSTGMCLKLMTGPPNSIVRSPTLSNSYSCSRQRCQMEMEQGVVSFTDIEMSLTGTEYSLVIFSYIIDPYTKRIEKWEYITPYFDVYPPAPMVSKVEFTAAMNRLLVFFDRPTNMNEGVRTARDQALVAANNWDPYLWVGPCEDELAPSFIASLGNGPFCTWINTTVYMVSMGSGATVSKETQFLLDDRSRILYIERVKGRQLRSLPALTRVGISVAGKLIQPIFPRLPLKLPQPIPVIIGPSEINRCTKVFADGSLSYGKGARPYSSIKWGIDLSRSHLRAGMLIASEEPKFVRRELHLTDLLPETIVEATVTLRPNFHVMAGTSITISGLPGYLPTTITEACEAKEEQLPQIDCEWGRLYDECKAVSIYGHNASLFADHPTISGVPGAEWVVGGLDGLDEKQSRKQANFVVRVREGKYLPSATDTVFSFSFMNPSLDKTWFTDESRVDASDSVPISIEVAGSSDLSIVCLTQDCLLPKVKKIAKAPMQTPGTQGLEYMHFKMQDEAVEVSFSILTETTKVNSALNHLTLTFEIVQPLASGSQIKLVFEGLGPSFIAPPHRICLKGTVASQFACQNCTLSDGSMTASRSWGVWSNKSFTMMVKPGASVAAGRHSITFDLQNPIHRNRESCSKMDPTDCPSNVRAAIQFIPPGKPGKLIEVFGDFLGAGIIPQLTGSVAESNAVQGSLNVIHFRLKSNMDLMTGTSITLRGISVQPLRGISVETSANASNHSTSLLHCEGHSHEPSMSTTPSTQQAGVASCSCMLGSYVGTSLVIDLQDAQWCRTLVKGTLLSFAIVVRNPSLPQPAARITAEARYPGCATCGESCACVGRSVPDIVMQDSELDGQVLGAAVAFRLQGRISESNPVPGQKNVLTVSLSSNVALLAGSEYRLAGFRGMLPPQAAINYAGTLGLQTGQVVADWKARHYASGNSSVFPIPVTSTNGSGLAEIEESITRFNMTSGTLHLTLRSSLEAERALVFHISLINRERPYSDEEDALVGDSGANLTVESTPELSMMLKARAAVCTQTGGICPVAGDETVLAVALQGSAQALNAEPKFIHASVKESSKVLGSSIMLTFKVRLNFALRGGEARFVISNLGQVSTSSTSNCLFVKEVADFYPACVCTESEGEVCDSCSAERYARLSSLFFVWIPQLEHPDLEIDSPDSEPGSVVGSCEWKQEEGSFTIELIEGQNIAAEQDFEFSFTILNQKGQVSDGKRICQSL